MVCLESCSGSGLALLTLGLGIAGALADGELGSMVAESGVTVALVQALEYPKCNGQRLAGAVRQRFGFKNVTAGAGAPIARLLALS